jgi:hypothetical protein
MAEDTNVAEAVADFAQNDAPEISGQRIIPDRPPCHINFYSNADNFSAQMLQQIPELQAVAVIPIWEINMTNIPTGRIRLRNEQPPYTAQLFRVMQKLAEFGVDVHRDIMGQLAGAAGAANNLAEELRKLTAELAEIEQKISAAKAPQATK